MNPLLPRARQRGLTITELMVAVAVSLLATLAVFQTFAISEGHRRTATSGGDASFNGMVGLHVVQRDLRLAGYGINSPIFYGCSIRAYDESVSPPREFNLMMTPASIAQGASGAPDAVTIAYSSTDRIPVPIKIAQGMPSPAANFKVVSSYGVFAGDLLIAAEGGKDCTLSEATNTPSQAASGQTDLIIHNNGQYNNAAGVRVTAKHNKSGGLGVSYTTDGVLMNIGPGPTFVRYHVTAQGLSADYPLAGVFNQLIAANVVQLQAQYGIDADDDGSVESGEWTTTSPTTNVEWGRALAVRMAVAVRSALPERPDPATGVCDITTANPTWAGGTLDVGADAQWRCYRYRVFESATSLRNLIWRPE